MNIALKEWAVVIEALAQGRQQFLLRKGGIAEGRRGFEVQHREFLLYPTWEHQQRSSIRPEFHELFEQTQPRSRGLVSFQYLAQVSDILQAPPQIKEMVPLEAAHVWTPSYLKMRYEYRPERPLFLLLLRLFRLPAVGEIPEIGRYAGCRSWVTLDQALPVENAVPAAADDEWEISRKSLLEKLLKQGAQPSGEPSAGPAHSLGQAADG